MAERPRAWNIPAGRVSQRIQAFQDDSNISIQSQITPRSTAAFPRRGSAAQAPLLPDVKPEPVIEPVIEERHESSHKSASAPEEFESESTDTEDLVIHDVQTQERGRSRPRPTEVDVEPSSLDEVDEILDEVRSRLYSVQKIVRREQSGSSQIRDEMMDELGTMLDNAIATTMTPLHTPRPLTRGPSLRRSPSKKQSSVISLLGRSQSVKVSNSSPLKTDQFLLSSSKSTVDSPTGEIPRIDIPDDAYQSVTPIGIRRRRQSSEPGVFIPRRTGFPLSSPVRERALLWESMSRSSASDDTASHSSSHAKFHHVTPASKAEDPPKAATPPIPLALPQLLDAERREQQRLMDQVIELPKTEEVKSILELDTTPKNSTGEWPGRLHLADVGSSVPTVRQSTSFAQAAAHDEHYEKHRPSVVKTTIRDLLSATRRRVSGKGTAKDASTAKESLAKSAVEESESKSSVAELDFQDFDKHLPPPQAPPHEEVKIHSMDGEESKKPISRRSTLKHKLEAPPEKRSTSPVKQISATPTRGRERLDQSPGGRPYSLDQRFNLSPARSDSRGSRGSLTFNIKARVSPGRGVGKDDTELFVTANIESDHSDEDH